MAIIKYDLDTVYKTECLTLCPHGAIGNDVEFNTSYGKDIIRVGSCMCQECKYFKGQDKKELSIICNYYSLKDKLALIRKLIK
jgi:hypothetical protein